MAKAKSKIVWFRLIASIVLAQTAGAVGSIFTFSAIPTWYAYLNKPTFSPPNWLFGPVWTILYTLMGISFYIIWMKHNKKTFWMVKFFIFHLFLNSLWSILFFGIKNLGLAFFEIVIMWSTIVYMIFKFRDVDKWASYLLIPYLLWVSFASVLNYSIWMLNPNNQVKNVFAQDFTFNKAREDYIFVEDNYKKDLFDFNLKKGAYKNNPTLSLKEELRLSLYKYIGSRNNYIKSYLTMLRIRTLEANGLSLNIKENIYSKIDPEVVWFESRKNEYKETDKLEDILLKSKDEDSHYKNQTIPAIYFALAYNSIGKSIEYKSKHLEIYTKLKQESQDLINLGRADSGLFDRWFTDIDKELNLLSGYETSSEAEILKIFSDDEYQRDGAYKKSLEKLSPAKDSLSRLNNYVLELENAIANKR